MKTLTIIALLISGNLTAAEKSHSDGGAVIPGIPQAAAEIHRLDADEQKAFQLEDEADFVAEYTRRGELNIHVGRTDEAEGTFHPHFFVFDEVETFFNRQKHKKLIVVIIHKQTWSEEKLKVEVEKIQKYFVARGYKRIVIQQYFGLGRGTHLDFTVAQKPPNKS